MQRRAREIIERVVASQPATLPEATIRRPPRSGVFVAIFTGPEPGQQIAKSTGLKDYKAAMALAKQWEEEARRAREARKAERQGSGSRRGMACGLSQAEVGALMDISERGVRAIERRAIAKLKRHPMIRAIWKEYTESRLSVTDEPAAGTLTSEEGAALLRLARTAFEFRTLQKILARVRQIP
jgi:hypothetical protein